MKTVRYRPVCVYLTFTFLALLLGAGAAVAEPGKNWVASWSASPQPVWEGDFPLDTHLPFHLWDQTIRQTVKISLGGDQVRIELSNTYGDRPLKIGRAALGRVTEEGALVSGSKKTLRFSGSDSITIPAGASILSDPVALELPDLSEIAVDLYLPEPTALTTFHWDGLQTAYVFSGDPSGEASATRAVDERRLPVRLFLSAVLVGQPQQRGVVVAFGDSITDGNGSTMNSNHRWPDFLAQRLVPSDVAIINAGISGARLLRNGMGENALARFGRDVLNQPGVRSVIVLMGINDIGWPASALAPELSPVSADEIVGAYRQLVALAHARQIKVIGATLTPFEGALEGTPMEGYFSPAKERLRQQVNHWIRTSGAFDAVIDFDHVVRDPAHPTRIAPMYDSGDHLHPGDGGYRAMAEAVDLESLL